MNSCVRWADERDAAALLSAMASDEYGMVSSSEYETARLVTLAPWLGGHRQRVLFLLHSQRPDGTWGGAEGYGLVPTLSATEALLTCLRRWADGSGLAVDYDGMVRGADRGLRALCGWLEPGPQIVVPDTVAAEILVPALVEQVNTHLDMLAAEPVSGLDIWRGSRRLRLPREVDDRLLARLRHAVGRGDALPRKVLHSLEALGLSARGAPFVYPVRGAVGCSPAATAAWVDNPAGHASVDYLNIVQNRGGGPVPGVTPIPIFERAWVVAALTTAGLRVRMPPGLTDSLHAAFGQCGVGAGPGLPADSDDTAGALYALAQLGSPRPPDYLWDYQVDTYFRCFPDERTPSTSTNAHILQAFGKCLEYDVPQRSRYQVAMGTLSGWLRDCQDSAGTWWDKWHASPYYATACCAIALHRHSRGAATTGVCRAVEWLLGSQRADGSWGRWSGTYEETAYAVQTLLQTWPVRADRAIEQAAARGCMFLTRAAGDPHPPLWHGKDLFTPLRVVRAEGLAALHLASAHPHVAVLLSKGTRTGSGREGAE